jgi:flagellar biosynthesis protein FlhA
METGQVVLTELARLMAEAENRNVTPVVVCAPQLRAAVRRMVQPSLGRMPVVSYRELSGGTQVRSIGVVTGRMATVSV